MAAMLGLSRAIIAAPAEENNGGLGRAAGDFAAGLRAEGVDTTFIGTQPRGLMANAAATRVGLRVSSSLLRLAQARDVRSAVPKSGWDLCYAVAGSVPVERASGIVVIHQSTHYPTIEFDWVSRGARATGGRGDLTRTELRRRMLEIRRADLIHVTTASVREEFLEAGVPAQRLVFAPLGVDIKRYSPAQKSAALELAFVGPFSMRKGVDVVAELAGRLDGAATVTAVGGPICRWSRAITDRARFTIVPSVAEMLGRAHIFLLPSRSDAFSYAVLEALASGTVPIVTPNVGAAEIVRRLDDRLVIPVDAYVEGVLHLLPLLDLSDLGRRARALALEYDRDLLIRRAARAVLDAARPLAA